LGEAKVGGGKLSSYAYLVLPPFAAFLAAFLADPYTSMGGFSRSQA